MKTSFFIAFENVAKNENVIFSYGVVLSFANNIYIM